MTSDTDAHVGEGTSSGPGNDLLRVAWLLRGWDSTALASATRTLGALCATRCDVRLSGPVWLAADEGRDARGYVVSLVARETQAVCAFLEVEGEAARALVDLALGGTADTAELALVEGLDATRQGVLLYLAASVLAGVPQDALAIAGLAPAHTVARPMRVACAALLTLQGRTYGAMLSVAPGANIPDPWAGSAQRLGELPAWARERPCTVSVELARGGLPRAELEALEPGDLLVADETWADGGPWSTAALRCDAFGAPVAALRLDVNGALRVDSKRPLRETVCGTALVSLAGRTTFSVEAARVSVPFAELACWLDEGQVPLAVDAAAPLTLFVASQPLALGRLVRDGGTVGLCIERVLRAGYSSSGSPNSAA